MSQTKKAPSKSLSFLGPAMLGLALLLPPLAPAVAQDDGGGFIPAEENAPEVLEGAGRETGNTGPEYVPGEDELGSETAERASGDSSCGDKIVGGCEAEPGSWPSMTTILTTQGQFFCGGTIIDAEWILTASHCVVKVDEASGQKSVISPDSIMVRTGASRLDNAGTRDQGREARVVQIVSHENYTVTADGQHFINDIALLRLAQPSNAPRQILARQADVPMLTKPDTMATVIGFGYTQEGGAVSPKLMQVDVPIASEQLCKTGYPALEYGVRLCAGYEKGGKDSCQGDSGGPLFVRDSKQQPVQVGVVSYGRGCAREKAWGVYASVGSFESWIKGYVPNAVFSNVDSSPPEDPSLSDPLQDPSLKPFVDQSASDSSSQKGRVTVAVVPGSRVKVGQSLKIRITSTIEGRLIVLNRDSSGATLQLFPNGFNRATQKGAEREFIRAGTTIQIPATGDGFDLKASPPAGQNEIIVLVVPKDAKTRDLTEPGEGMKSVSDPDAYMAELSARSDEADEARGVTISGTTPKTRALGSQKYTIVP